MESLKFLEYFSNWVLVVIATVSSLSSLWVEDVRIATALILFFLGIMQVLSAIVRTIYGLVKKVSLKQLYVYWGMVFVFFTVLYILNTQGFSAKIKVNYMLQIPLLIAFYYINVLKRFNSITRKRSSFLPNINF